MEVDDTRKFMASSSSPCLDFLDFLSLFSVIKALQGAQGVSEPIGVPRKTMGLFFLILSFLPMHPIIYIRHEIIYIYK